MKNTDNLTYEQAINKLAEYIHQEAKAMGLDGLNRGPAFYADVTFKAISIGGYGANGKIQKATNHKVAALLTMD